MRGKECSFRSLIATVPHKSWKCCIQIMSQEILNDSILDNQSKIVKTLGWIGFGWAYLAQDSRRDDEQCALKEFVPFYRYNGVKSPKCQFVRDR
jgi:hypothetical protein